ncbi:MAG TPA: hypothetical protein VEH06_12800 [Candidatus Bathyarchaeia archaeon]|jgi:hypothetical protein|nr:hypothetical protein [Candidatus Bathyarchaeia archaeon]
MAAIVEGEKKIAGRNFLGGLIEGINYPAGRIIPLKELLDWNDVIIVDRKYFLKNRKLIEAWASKKF